MNYEKIASKAKNEWDGMTNEHLLLHMPSVYSLERLVGFDTYHGLRRCRKTNHLSDSFQLPLHLFATQDMIVPTHQVQPILDELLLLQTYAVFQLKNI